MVHLTHDYTILFSTITIIFQRPQMLAAAFDPSLGGRSIDLAIAHHLAKGFNKPGSDVTKNKRSWIRLLAEV